MKSTILFFALLMAPQVLFIRAETVASEVQDGTKSEKCISMTDERAQEVRQIIQEITDFIDQLALQHSYYDVRLVKLDIGKYNSIADSSTALDLFVDDCNKPSLYDFSGDYAAEPDSYEDNDVDNSTTTINKSKYQGTTNSREVTQTNLDNGAQTVAIENKIDTVQTENTTVTEENVKQTNNNAINGNNIAFTTSPSVDVKNTPVISSNATVATQETQSSTGSNAVVADNIENKIQNVTPEPQQNLGTNDQQNVGTTPQQDVANVQNSGSLDQTTVANQPSLEPENQQTVADSPPVVDTGAQNIKAQEYINNEKQITKIQTISKKEEQVLTSVKNPASNDVQSTNVKETEYRETDTSVNQSLNTVNDTTIQNNEILHDSIRSTSNTDEIRTTAISNEIETSSTQNVNQNYGEAQNNQPQVTKGGYYQNEVSSIGHGSAENQLLQSLNLLIRKEVQRQTGQEPKEDYTRNGYGTVTGNKDGVMFYENENPYKPTFKRIALYGNPILNKKLSQARSNGNKPLLVHLFEDDGFRQVTVL